MESIKFNERGKYCKFSLSRRLKKLENEFKANGGEFKEYTIGDLFDVENDWCYGKNKQYISKFSLPTKRAIPVISGITVNNGVNYYTKDNLNETELFKDCLTISTRGEYSGTVTYHEGIFCLANNILTMPLKGWSKKANLYFATLVQKLGYGGYSGYPTKATLSKDIIIIPTKDNQIDFAYMEKYIHVLEEERIHVLEDYLKVSNLDDYELTKDELMVLSKIQNKEVQFKEFSIMGDKGVFEVKNTHSILQEWITPDSGIYPYVTAGESNNSVSTYISYDNNCLENGNSIMIGGKTLIITYQEQDYFSNDSHNLALYLKNKEVQTKRKQLFLVTSLYKNLKPKYSWGDSISKTKIKGDTVWLPLNSKNEIDYDLMETYIKAIEKKVIQNVIAWKDKEIEKTKEFVFSEK